jgi:hypothetical protein
VRHTLIALCAAIAASCAAPAFAVEGPSRATRLDPYKNVKFESCRMVHGRKAHGRCAAHRPKPKPRAVGQNCVRSGGGRRVGVAGDPCH